MEFELKFRKADLKKDLPEINSWYAQWKKASLPEWWYPEDVFIIPGVICVSYYKTNSKLAYIENVISNPNCPSDFRRIGLGMIGDYIFKIAKEQGFKAVLGWTNNKSVSSTSADHGMKVSDHKYAVMVKSLEDKQ